MPTSPTQAKSDSQGVCRKPLFIPRLVSRSEHSKPFSGHFFACLRDLIFLRVIEWVALAVDIDGRR